MTMDLSAYKPILDYSVDSLIAEINAKNKVGRPLVPSDVVLSARVLDPNDSAAQDPAVMADTELTVTAAPGSIYQGSQILKYRRLAVSDLASLLVNKVNIPSDVTTVYQALPHFLIRHGVKLYEEDFEDGPVDWTESGAAYTLTAKETSLHYTGTADFTSIVLLPNIRTGFTSLALDTPEAYREIPDEAFEDAMAEVYTFGVDCSPHSAALREFTKDQVLDNAALVALVNLVRGDDVSAKLTQETYTVAYNGLTSSVDVANSSYKNVLIIDSMASVGSGVSGYFFMHYNDE